MTEPFDTNARADAAWKDLVNPTPSDVTRKADVVVPYHFERIGGAKAVREAVDRLYLLIFNDDELVPYFEGKDMPLLQSHMASLLTRVLGGPDGYAGQDLVAVHQKLGITGAHFYKVADYLLNVLLNMGGRGRQCGHGGELDHGRGEGASRRRIPVPELAFAAADHPKSERRLSRCH